MPAITVQSEDIQSLGFCLFFCVFFFPNWVLNTMVKIAPLFFRNG